MNSLKYSVSATAIITGLAFFLVNYSYTFLPPTGLHFIRQTDSLAFTMYYLKNSDFNFFNIGNLNLFFSEGKTACEFPLVYYINFLLFKAFGIHFSIVRILSLCFSSISIYYLSRGAYLYLQNLMLSVSLVIVTIASTVYRYYSFNFLPDSYGVSCIFIALYWFFAFERERSLKSLRFIFLFTTLAALFKIYFGVYLVGFTIYLALKRSFSIRTIFFTSLISVLSITAWYTFSICYNKFYGSNYYLTSSVPFWNMSSDEIDRTLDFIFDFWYTKYYYQSIFHLFIVLFIVVVLPIRNQARAHLLLLFILFFGLICYFCLFFFNFRDHDYYFLPFIPFFFLLGLFSLKNVFNYYDNRIYKAVVILTTLIIGSLGFNYTSLNIHRRFSNDIDRFSMVTYQLDGVHNLLEEHQINENSKFLVVGDKTVNGSLIFLNRYGWIFSKFEGHEKEIAERLKSADYLLVLSPSVNRVPVEIKKMISYSNTLKYRNNFIYLVNRNL